MGQRERLILDSKGHSAIDEHKKTGDKRWIPINNWKRMNNRVSPAPSDTTTQSTLTLDTDRNKQQEQAKGSVLCMESNEHDIESNNTTKNNTAVFTAVEAFDNEDC